MAQKTFDIIIIGAGPAGSAAAHAAAEAKHRVALIERDMLGGTCLNYGCDPTKTLLHLANQIAEARLAHKHGVHFGDINVDWPAVQAYLRRMVNRLRGGADQKARAALGDLGIAAFKGEAHFTDPHTVQVGDDVLQSDHILIATGSAIVPPPVQGLDDVGFLTNKDAIWQQELPGSMAIVGGGPIGIEFAQIFSRFGVRVTVIEQAPLILPKDDQELAERLRHSLENEGIRIITGVELKKAQRQGKQKHLVVADARGGEQTLGVDELMIATGFKPVVDSLDLRNAGVRTYDGTIVVDETLRTNVPHIWSAGDVTGGFQFTSVAEKQGELVIHNMFTTRPQPFDSSVVPWTTYTSPELAHVGKTEEEVRESGVAFEVLRQEMGEIERAAIVGAQNGLVKIIVGRGGKVLGAHILGPWAGEMIAPLALAMHADLPISALAQTLLPYPTLAVAVQKAAATR